MTVNYVQCKLNEKAFTLLYILYIFVKVEAFYYIG